MLEYYLYVRSWIQRIIATEVFMKQSTQKNRKASYFTLGGASSKLDKPSWRAPEHGAKATVQSTAHGVFFNGNLEKQFEQALCLLKNKDEKEMNRGIELLKVLEKAGYKPADFELLVISSNAGDADASFKIGQYYECGIGGVRQSFDVASEWYKRAFEQGHKTANKAEKHCIGKIPPNIEARLCY